MKKNKEQRLTKEGWTHYWNYRVVKKGPDNHQIDNQGVAYGIHEVYYENDSPWACTIDPIRIVTFSESLTSQSKKEATKELKQILRQIEAALDKPILNYEDIGEYHD